MFKKANPLFLICETPLHVGSGDSLGIVDLPIQRERHTDFPKVESSSLKGALREAFEQAAMGDTQAQIKIHVMFGYDDAGTISEAVATAFTSEKIENENTQQNSKKGAKKPDLTEFAGCLGFTDARLLLFPVKSMKGVFAWVTCPYILERLKEDLALANIELNFDITQLENTRSTENSKITVQGDQVVFEEYTFTLTPKPEVDELATWLKQQVFNNTGYWADRIGTHLAVIGNDEFRDFVIFSTEVITRTKIDNSTGTVMGGALFTEELLPAESVMYSLVLASPELSRRETKIFANDKAVMTCFKEVLTKGLQNRFQLGGNSTLGKGIMQAVLGGTV